MIKKQFRADQTFATTRALPNDECLESSLLLPLQLLVIDTESARALRHK